MAELSIKVTIAGRVYPLKVSPSEEEGIRKSAKLINERIKEYEENFSVRDKQDLLAMAALQFANEATAERQKALSLEGPTEKLAEIDGLISSYLSALK